jgi:agmatine deiminase
MLWPERPDVWRERGRPAGLAFAAVAKAIATTERVTVGVSPARFEEARTLLPAAVHAIALESDDAWMRDIGPSFVCDERGAMRGVCWRFNAWGGLEEGLYAPWDKDQLVARKVLTSERLDFYEAPYVLEGGAIQVDGEGTLIATEACVLNPNRNPNATRALFEAAFRDYLGIERVIWLPRGLPDDETGGHIDNLCCFAAPASLGLAWTDDPADPFHAVCREAEALLKAARDARGRALTIVRVPQPSHLGVRVAEADGLILSANAKPRRPGDPITASYINAYVGNGLVVMPSFGVASDEPAREAMAELHSGRQVIQVPAREIVLGGGGIHCITHEQPRPRGIPRPFLKSR